MGAFASQPRGTQYWSKASNVVSSMSGQPLGGGHVAVETGDEEAGGEPVVDRERLAVHADDEHRRALAVDGIDREPAGVAVDRATDDLVGALLHAGFLEDLGEGDAEPAGGAGEAAADLVGDAGERDVGLDEVPLQQVVVGEGDLVVDHALHGQLPGVDGDLRNLEGGVDPVEGVVRGDERGGSVDAGVELLDVEGSEWLAGLGEHDLGPVDGSVEAGAQPAAGGSGAGADDGDRSSGGEEPATAGARRGEDRAGIELAGLLVDDGRLERRVGVDQVGVVSRFRVGGVDGPGTDREEPDHEDGDDAADDGRHCGECAAHTGQRSDGAEHAEHRCTDGGDREVLAGHHTEDDGEDRQEEHDGADEDRLVLGTEVLDGEGLQPGRRGIDDAVADLRDRRGETPIDARHELGGPECADGGHESDRSALAETHPARRRLGGVRRGVRRRGDLGGGHRWSFGTSDQSDWICPNMAERPEMSALLA